MLACQLGNGGGLAQRRWSDTALALFLAGEAEPRGRHLENLVLMDLLAWRDVQARRSRAAA